MACSKSHASVINTSYFVCLRAAKYVKMQCSIRALKMVHIFIHILDEHHKSDKAGVAALVSTYQNKNPKKLSFPRYGGTAKSGINVCAFILSVIIIYAVFTVSLLVKTKEEAV